MIYGLVGKYLQHSFSKEIFEKELWGACEPHSFEYLQTDDLAAAIRQLRSDDRWGGLMVTTPYKEAVIPMLDRLSCDARELGAVNCIRRLSDGTLWGTNTDWQGFRDALFRYGAVPKVGLLALVLGTGGAAKSVIYALRQLGIRTEVASRSEERGTVTYAQLSESGLQDYQLIINATPLGTPRYRTEKPDLPYPTINPDATLLDLNYNPGVTPFLLEGLKRGACVQNGLQMLISQARVAWTFFTTNEQTRTDD